MAGETALTVRTVDQDNEYDFQGNLENADTGNNNSAANPNGDLMLFCYNNGATGEATVTITAQTTSYSKSGEGTLTKSDKVVTLSTGEFDVVGPFAKSPWNDANDNIIITAGGTGAADVDYVAFRPVFT